VANDGRLILSRTDIDGVLSAPLLTDLNWHHLAVTKAGSNAVFYVDGVAQATPAYVPHEPYTFDDGTCSCNAAIAIGSRGDERGGTFYGMIDEPAVFDRALSASEVQSIYAAGSAGMCPQVACTPAPAGMVSWWRGEDCTADTVGGNNGTIAGTGTVTYGPGVVGQAFVIDGTHRDRLDLGNPVSLQLQDFTLEAWVKRSSPTITAFDILGADGSVCGEGACIIGWGRGGYILAVANDGRLILSRTDIDGVLSAPLLTDLNWHHLAVTKAGSDAVFYVDGVAQATPLYVPHEPYTFDDGTCSCNAAIAIGSRGDARGGTFYGMIDEPAVFNRALSGSEVQSIYAAGSAGLCHESPGILTPPSSQRVTLGKNATFNVVAGGSPPLQYQWRFNGVALAGATGSTLTFTVGTASGGSYSVVVTNAFGSVTSTDAVLEVNYPPVADAGATMPLVLSANNSNAIVVLNGSRSSDPDGDVLQYFWFETGAAEPLASGAVAPVTLPLGTNVLTLSVSDGLATNSQTFAVELITPAQAVARLVALCQSGVTNSHPLIATLSAALAAIDRSNPAAAINQLQAFQNKVRAQVAPLDPALATTFIQEAQDIIDALGGGSRPNGRLTLSLAADRTIRLRGPAAPGVLYIIESSTNLVNWERIGVATNNGLGAFEFVHTNTTFPLLRFYRALSP
jgi:hypothetical protein